MYSGTSVLTLIHFGRLLEKQFVWKRNHTRAFCPLSPERCLAHHYTGITMKDLSGWEPRFFPTTDIFFFPWTTWLTTELFEMGDAWELRFDCIWFPGLLQQSCCNKAAPTGRLETTIYSFTALETRSLKGSDVRCSTVPLQHLGQDSPLPLMASGGGWPSLVFLGSWQPDCELCFHFPIAFFTGLPGFFLLIRTLVIGFRVPPI